MDEAKEAGLGQGDLIYKELALPKEKRAIHMKHMPLTEEITDPLKNWSGRIFD